jgi:hypothetical protein
MAETNLAWSNHLAYNHSKDKHRQSNANKMSQKAKPQVFTLGFHFIVIQRRLKEHYKIPTNDTKTARKDTS